MVIELRRVEDGRWVITIRFWRELVLDRLEARGVDDRVDVDGVDGR